MSVPPPQPPTPDRPTDTTALLDSLYVEQIYAVPLTGDGNPHSKPRLLTQNTVNRGLAAGDRLSLGDISGYVVRVEWHYPQPGTSGPRTARVHVATADYANIPNLGPARAVPALETS